MADAPINLPHIILPDLSQPEKFKSPRRFPSSVPSQVLDREAHAQALIAQAHSAVEAGLAAMKRRANVVPPAQNGYYLKVDSRPNEPLLADRFEQKRNKGVELLTVEEHADTGMTTASLFVPAGSADFLERTVEDYRTKLEPRAKEPKAKHRDLVEGIGGVSLATIRDLWFRPGTTDRFRSVAAEYDVYVGAHPLVFPEDVAVLVEGSPEQLAAIIEVTVSVSRLGRAKKNSAFILAAPLAEQHAQVDDVLARLNPPATSRNAVCILDTGVNRNHPLFGPLLRQEDCLAYRPSWGVEDHDGHGTKMAGICAFGDLHYVLTSGAPISVPYRLESVKIFPPQGQNPHDLLGAITAGGVARAELNAPERQRVFCLATSTDEDTPHRGRPTSWSAELDQLCSGAEEESRRRRLICVAAGNIRDLQLKHNEYLQANDLAELESPGHCWNALTIGSFTEKVDIQSHGYDGWQAFGTAGDLSPTSRTASWDKTWPVKPDVVFEGGNLGVDPADGRGYGVADLQLITTSSTFPEALFECAWETSAATANASRLAAFLQSAYPNLWLETIRALIVNSADWTDTMQAHLPPEPKKADFALLTKRYGYGVPDLSRALRSAQNDLTLIEQSTIQPFSQSSPSVVALNEMSIYPLPWPVQQLTDLGTEETEMKVTLSYFIDPNPAESARNRRGRYASHGLRFAVKLPDESIDDFRKRINKAARSEGESSQGVPDAGWLLGPQLRDRGSLHSDIWRGPASDLARRGVIAVYPVGGWWKERLALERFNSSARFALVVTISTPTIETNLYTAITNQIVIPVQAT